MVMVGMGQPLLNNSASLTFAGNRNVDSVGAKD
jgi:hypothetical protein